MWSARTPRKSHTSSTRPAPTPSPKSASPANKPTGPGSPTFHAPGEIPKSASGPQPQSVQVVDLDPGIYHYRVAASQSITGGPEVLGPEETFTVPAAPATPAAVAVAATPRRFRLRHRNIRVSHITRHSKRLIVRLHGLPAKTRVKLKLIAHGAKQSARRKANRNGRLTFKLVLSKRIRKALRKPKVKRVRLRFKASPPDEASSHLTLTKRIQGRKRSRSHH